MRFILRPRLVGAAVLTAALALLVSAAPSARAAAWAQEPGFPAVLVQRVGTPAWTPTDLHVFSAPIGTAGDGYAEFTTTIETILPPPHYTLYTGLGIGPGTPETPPYTHDIGNGVAAAGYDQGALFAPQQFSNGEGVWLAFMVVPTPRTRNIGSSPDFASGPIIPNSLFPIAVTGVAYRNGQVFDPALADFDVPAIDGPPVDPPIDVDGFSHFPIFSADNADFGPTGTPLPGLYRYRLSMLDSTGNGWNISAYFVIT
jgi:hypothetical protein